MNKNLLSFVGVLIVGALLTACGNGRSVIKISNNAESTETTVSVSGVTGGSTSVDVSPDVKVNVNLGNNE